MASRLSVEKPVDTASEDASVGASSAGSETRLIKAVHSVYKRWAFFIVNNTYKVITVCTLITLICTVKILLSKQRNDITGYTPYGARSLIERDIRNEFFDQNGIGVAIMVLAEPKKGDNILKPEYLKELVEIDDFVRTNFTILNHFTNKTENFDEFCSNFCKLNEPLRNFYNGLKLQTSAIARKEPLNDRIRLNYPKIDVYGQKINIQQSIYGVHFKNETSPNDFTNLEYAEMAALIYKSEREGGWTDDELKEYETAVSDYFEMVYKSKNLHVMTISTTYVEAEIVRAGLTMLPFLLIGFTIMCIVSSTTVLLSAVYFQQVSIYKIALAIMACVCPFMASGTALGLMFFAGIRYGSILLVTPFLVLAIGVDDAYLMIHAWQRVSKQMRENPTPEDSVAHRLSLVLIDTGPAILISALTNILADAVGSFTGSPEVTLLCAGNMASIFVDFLYQITFYTSVMAIVGNFEMRSEQRMRFKLSIPIGAAESVKNPMQMVPSTKSKQPSGKFHQKVKKNFNKFVITYVDVITNTIVAVIVCIFWTLFLIHSVYWLTQFEVNLTTKKMFASDSPLLAIDHRREEQIVPYYTVITVFINHPGDLGDPERVKQLYHLVHELESFPESWGPESTSLFLPDFLAFEEQSDQEEEGEGEQMVFSGNRTKFNADDFKTFLEWPEYDWWKGFLKLREENNHTILESFFFTTAYQGDHLKSWSERSRLLGRWRAVTDRYPQFNATSYQDEGIFLDLIDNMPTDAWQSALATLCCMAFVCFVFMYDTYSVLVASGVIASIMTGMLGTLCWEGVTMDPIMMAAMVISIGFSVDIPAHVSYHYHSAGFEDPNLSVKERLILTLSSVGFPAIQASFSTNLVVLSLLFVPLYMAQVFVKIMFLCIVLTIVHSLVMLPAIFSLIEKISGRLKN
ncbi:unnamed protein product [Bursaphelenchus xylophilus]|uniref:(pine wood nematode) hypothetical protein n=1 Tax=Bursaphelenchus xylophilus TaxID=6326 RepID=A0A1I7RLP2_BURXY|nr:unnamed protein product [Bursaphelenchus xylophilus]CAG9082748.1 unnamed protein product [Bursaphelenchus xylophilus]